jgi:hypothetical protein
MTYILVKGMLLVLFWITAGKQIQYLKSYKSDPNIRKISVVGTWFAILSYMFGANYGIMCGLAMVLYCELYILKNPRKI